MSSSSASGTTITQQQQQQQTARTKTGCQNCRLRHLKCDEVRPCCARCEKAGIDCVRGYNIRFRHSTNSGSGGKKAGSLAKNEYEFGRKQTWMKTARNLTFLDETQELMNIYDHDTEDAIPFPIPTPWPAASSAQKVSESKSPRKVQPQKKATETLPTPDSPVSVRPEAPQYPWPLLNGETRPSPATAQLSRSPVAGHVLSDFRSRDGLGNNHLPKRRRLTFESSYHSSAASDSPVNHLLNQSPVGSWHTGWTPGDALKHITSNSDLDLASFAGLETTVSSTLSRIYLDSPAWPLQDKEEARLLRHFVEKLSRNFDLTDPLNHFRAVVPQRAASCPTLMNAIFALSARHLSRIGEYDPLVSNKYHQECLKHLIPMLDDTSAILDENLLASTIILRHLEEFEVPISSQLDPADQHSHLLGAQAFIAAQERAAIAGGLRQAAFWVGLRQEVYVAFVNQRPVLPALEHCNVDRSFEAAEDYIWACRMVVLCADVLRYCFSDGQHTVPAFTYLQDQVSQWYDRKPASFTPVYYRDPHEDEVFPEVWYVGDEHATGIQHFHLARILLSSHNPSIPRLGPGRAAALKNMDDEIRQHVRTLCGMCLSNVSTAPAFTYASMAVTMAGDKFTLYHEQRALLEVLDKCDKMHAWPTGQAITNLKAAWGWKETENFV